MKSQRIFILGGSAILAISSASADFTGAAHDLLIQHGVYTVGPNSAVPLYTPEGFMLTPGGGYPTVGATAPVNTVGLIGATGSPGFAFLNLASAPVGLFGGASTKMFSHVGPKAGRLWWTDYTIQDVPSNNGFGSYNVSGGNVLFDNNARAVGGRAGIFFPFQGFAAGPNAYVAGAMLFQFTVFNAAAAIVNQFTLGVHFGFDGLGPRPDGVAVYGTTPAFWGWGFNHFGATFNGYGLAWVPVEIPPNGSFLLQGRLTMLADPDAGASLLDSYFDVFTEIDIRNMPYMGYTPVPEPSSMLALTVGAMGILLRRKRRH